MVKKALAKESAGQLDKFGVFISWSGDISRLIAEALGTSLIPNVFQDVQTFVSSNDIDAGSNWFGRISTELATTEFGVVCITKDNMTKQWIHFEAGALAKKVTGRSRVVPYLHGVVLSDLSPPLSLFQGMNATKEGTLGLLRSLNRVRSDPFESSRLQGIFEKWWPEFEAKLQALPASPTSPPAHRPDRDLLEEMLAILRSSDKDKERSIGHVGIQETQRQSRETLRVQVLSKIGELEAVLLSSKDSDFSKTAGIRNIIQELKMELYRI